jgi:hypothetical protein
VAVDRLADAVALALEEEAYDLADLRGIVGDKDVGRRVDAALRVRTSPQQR